MWKKAVPKVEWESGINGAQHRDKMIFEGAYRSFCCIDSVIVRFDEGFVGREFMARAEMEGVVGPVLREVSTSAGV